LSYTPISIQAQLELGEALRESGKRGEATEVLEKALAAADSDQGNPWDRARVRFVLAKALWDEGKERPRAHELADESRDRLAKLGNKVEPARIADWLASHR
jgi:hypothetical protein